MSTIKGREQTEVRATEAGRQGAYQSSRQLGMVLQHESAHVAYGSGGWEPRIRRLLLYGETSMRVRVRMWGKHRALNGSPMRIQRSSKAGARARWVDAVQQ